MAGRRRRIALVLSAAAAAMAGSVALTPLVGGARLPDVNPPVTGWLEGSGFDHNLAHLGSTPAARRRAAARSRRCSDPGWRSAHPDACPAPGATPSGARVAAASTDVGARETTQPDGVWGPLLSVPSTAIHAAVLPTGKVLWFSQPKAPVEQVTDGGNAHLWDPATGQSTPVPPPEVDYPADPANPAGFRAPANLWCAGQVLLADGRLLVVGGNLAYPQGGGGAGAGAGTGFKGGAWVMTFDPWTETWTQYQEMESGGRWYPTLTLLPDGRVLIVGGWDETGGLETGGDPSLAPTMVNNQSVEVFDPDTPAGGLATSELSRLPPNGPGQPSPYPDHTSVGLYPHMFVLPDTTAAGAGGTKVLVAGPNQWDSAIIDTMTGVWEDVFDQPYVDGVTVPLSSDRAWGTAWLEPSGPDGSDRVILLGGSDTGAAAPGPGQSTPPLATAEVLDLDAPGEGWKIDPALELNSARAHFNTVLLPDGSILTNGGGYGRKNGSLYADPVYTSELLPPGGAGGWRAVGAEADARTYHSTAVLLPDGRVLSAGDDRDLPFTRSGTETVDDHIALANRTAQVWSPPYLFAGVRPAVTFAPQAVRYDAPFRVAVQGAPGAIARAVLMRPGAVTHAVDMSQQSITLGMTAQADGLTMTSPLNATVAPPGWYMLFLVDSAGVPSRASWIRLDPAAPDAPALPVGPAPAPPSAPAPAPAPAPPTTTPSRLRVSVPAPRVRAIGTRRVRLVLRMRASRRSVARIVVARPGGRVVARRTVQLRRGRTVRRVVTVPRARLRGSRRLAVRVVVRDAGGRRLARTRIVRVPPPRRGR